MIDMRLTEFKPESELVVEDHTPARARFPVVDVNNQLGKFNYKTFTLDPNIEWNVKDVQGTLALMDELNVKCVVNLAGGWGDMLRMNLERYKIPFPDRFLIFANIDFTELNNRGFAEKWSKELERSIDAGAQGLKVYKMLGLQYRDELGNIVMPDDPRFDPIWAKAGELGIPILIHSSDPVAFFHPLDEANERWEELSQRPEWHFYGKGLPSHIELIESQLRVVERHSGTNFISSHVLSYAENLGYVSQCLDRYENLYVDFTERIAELGRQPYSARKFMIKYADRILLGSDYPPDREIFQTYFRFLETYDEYFESGRNQGRWRIYGINLPDEALQKIYYQNACKLIPGLDI